MHLCMYTHIKHIYIYMYMYIYIYIYIYICRFIYTCMYTYSHKHLYIHVCICTCMYIYMYACVYIYTHDSTMHTLSGWCCFASFMYASFTCALEFSEHVWHLVVNYAIINLHVNGLNSACLNKNSPSAYFIRSDVHARIQTNMQHRTCIHAYLHEFTYIHAQSPPVLWRRGAARALPTDHPLFGDEPDKRSRLTPPLPAKASYFRVRQYCQHWPITSAWTHLQAVARIRTLLWLQGVTDSLRRAWTKNII